MNTLFEYILNNYLDGEKVDNGDKGYHKILVKQLPHYINTLLGDKYKITGSCGASNKAEIPWLGIFNTDITTTAQTGIYIVYLFKADMSGFYLCLGQGATNFEKYGKAKDEIMYKVADYYKNKIESNFSKDSIDLLAKNQNGKNYEKVNILNKYYSKEMIKSCNLENDLMEMLKIYDDLAEEMKYQTYNETIDNLISNTDPNYIAEKEAVELLEENLLKESGLDQAEIVTLKLADIPKGRKKSKYTEITTKTIRKIDYGKKQQKDAENGLLGEKLVMQYEESKLRDAGREDLISKIEWISKEDDSVGYDILSFDEKGNKIYIEVKTTEGKDNSAFFISVKEVNTMEIYKDKYFIYRVYDVNSPNPGVFILNYNEFKDRIKLDYYNYVATLKSE